MEPDGDRIEMDGIVEGDEAPLAGDAELTVDDENAIPIGPVHAVPMVPAQDDLDAYPHGPTDEIGSPVDPILRCPEPGCTETATTHAAE
jgi:hypothetical protein